MTGPDQDKTPDPTNAPPGHDSEPRHDGSPAVADDGTHGTESSAQPDEVTAPDELRSLQDTALGEPSQESLLRLLGWHPGDPLPDELSADLDTPGVTRSPGDAPAEDALDEAAIDAPHIAGEDADDPGYGTDGTDLPGANAAGLQGRGRLLGGVTAAADADLLLPPEPEPVVPINWNTLDAERAEQEWWQLDAFVYWLRDDFGLTPQELPPMWHRHTELVWELSALRTAWLAAHAEDAHPGSPLMWLRDLSDARRRLRDWVQRCGTTLTEDRCTRRTTWPGEEAATSPAPVMVTDRAADFGVFVADDVTRRREIEVEAQAEVEHLRAQRLRRLRSAWGLPTTPADTAQDGDRHEPGTADEEGTS